MCQVDGCEKPVHSRGLCQAHYRRVQRWGSLEEALKHHPKPRRGKTDHRALDPAEKEQRAAERAVRRAAKTRCANDHPLTPENVYVNPGSGQVVCKVCRMNWQRARQGKPPLEREQVGAWNRDKTHCPAGHEYTEDNIYRRKDGSRKCRRCARNERLRYAYGIEPEQYDTMLARQKGCCAICRVALEEGANLAVDHDHETGAVRGLLCDDCNFGLGKFRDDPALLKAAARYVSR